MLKEGRYPRGIVGNDQGPAWRPFRWPASSAHVDDVVLLCGGQEHWLCGQSLRFRPGSSPVSGWVLSPFPFVLFGTSVRELGPLLPHPGPFAPSSWPPQAPLLHPVSE